MLEGVFVETIMNHSETRPYPIHPQTVSGITLGQGAIYRYSLPEADYPTLLIVDPLYDDGENFIPPGYYELALTDEQDYLLLIQSKEPVAIIPVFKVEEDASEVERLDNKKYKKQLKKREKEIAKTNAKRDKVGMSPVEDFVYKEATIEYDKEGDYYLIMYQRGTIRAWGAIKK